MVDIIYAIHSYLQHSVHSITKRFKNLIAMLKKHK